MSARRKVHRGVPTPINDTAGYRAALKEAESLMDAQSGTPPGRRLDVLVTLIEAYEKGQVDPTTVGYIECHGTGTSLGDPIEIQALSKAFSELYKKHNKAPAKTPHCGLSSVKTNIGHLVTAAGIASLLKVLLAIKHKEAIRWLLFH